MVVLGLTHRISNTTTTFGMLNPEITDALVRIRQCQVATLGMGETGGVEIELHVVLLGPVNPALEMFHLYLVAINELIAEVTIDLMEVQTVITSDECLYKLDVFTYLIYITGTTWIITCGLDTS